MKKLLLILCPILVFSQENSNYFKTQGEMNKYEPCIMYEELHTKYPNQFQREWMEGLDEILSKYPEYSRAYREKSATYIKAGDFINWKINVDKAVKYDAEGYLGIRAGLKAKFFGDYEGAIHDIDSLASISKFDLGYTNNGDYHLNVLKGIAYSKLGQQEKGIEIIERQLAQESHFTGLYDYYQLGIIYFELENFVKAIENFQKQLAINENAETHYYLGQSYKKIGDVEKYEEHKQLAIELYRKAVIMRDPYNEHINKVYFQTIAEN